LKELERLKGSTLFLKAHKSVVFVFFFLFFVTYLSIIGQTTFERIDSIENTHVSLFLKRKVHKNGCFISSNYM